jgi:hypothetical protein
MENAYVESFNGRFRDECLNENWFGSLADAREKIARWKQDYNELRPHSSLQYLTPMEFARQSASFYVDDVGEEASNAGPFPHTSIPATERGTGANKNRRKSHYPWTKNGGQVIVYDKLLDRAISFVSVWATHLSDEKRVW